MKTVPFKGILLSGILLTGVFLSTHVQASETQRQTNASITFETLLPPVIVDPLDPDVPKVPDVEEGDQNSEAGELTLDFAPNLYFGSHEIKQDGTYEFPALVNSDKVNNPGEETSNPFIQVTDRQLIPGNWNISVQSSSFKNNSDNKDSLNGAFLTFTNGILSHPTSNIAALDPILNPSIKVVSGESAVPVLSALEGQGALTWIAHWIPTTQSPEPRVALSIPANTMKKGTHSSELTWTLASTVGP